MTKNSSKPSNTPSNPPSSRPMTLRQQLHKDVHKVFEAFVEAFVNPKHVQIMKVMELVDDYSQEIAREALRDLLAWNEQWKTTHDEPFNWYGAVKAMEVMKEPRKPFVELTQKPENKE